MPNHEKVGAESGAQPDLVEIAENMAYEIAREYKLTTYVPTLRGQILEHLREVAKHEIGRASCRKECRSRWSPYH